MRIAGVGTYLPDRSVSTQEIALAYGVEASALIGSTGIEYRRFAAEGEGSAQLGAKAARQALDMATWSLDDADLIIFVTNTPNRLFPGPGFSCQAMLGSRKCPVLEVRNACAGFVFALVTTQAFLKAGIYERILIVAAETQSHAIMTPGTTVHCAVLFGDGAASLAICRDSTREGLIAFDLRSDGSGAELLHCDLFDASRTPYVSQRHLEERRHLMEMDGLGVFQRAVIEMSQSCKTVLARSSISVDDVTHFVPHQANGRILSYVADTLGIPSQKVLTSLRDIGNTSATSIPYEICQGVASGRIQPGDRLLLTAFGSGLAWGSALWGI